MLWEKNDCANKVVVVSDLHFGKSDLYAQNVANKLRFARFVDDLIAVGDVRELVIAGDFLDEWIVPLSCPAHDDSSQHYRDCLANNQMVVDALNRAMEADIEVVYVIGNHDMTLEADVLQEAMPKLCQARDARGLGVYYAGARHEIAVEHGHRYEAYSAPDTVSNRELAGNDDTILPPGYFYARLGTQWVAEGRPTLKVDYPVIDEAPQPDDIDQMGAYLHYKVMTEVLLSKYTPRIGFDEDVFGHTHVPDFHDFGSGRHYLNAGTWIDDNPDGGCSCTFVLIESGDVDTARVLRYCEDGFLEDITVRVTDAAS